MPFATVAINMALLVALSIPGFLLRKFKFFKENSVKTLVAVLIYAAQPFTAGKSFLTKKYSSDLGLNLLTAVGLFILIILLVLIAASFLFRRKNEEGKLLEPDRAYRFASMFGNTGYLGIPLIQALFPGNETMILYTCVCIVALNILTWTVGVYVLTGDKRYISIKKGLINPVPIAALLTMPFFFMQNVIVPEPIIKVVDLLGGMTTPLSMIILGARLAEMPFKEIFTDWRVYCVSAFRLVLAPALAFAFLKLFNVTDRDTFNTIMVVCAMPSAVATIVFAEKFLTSSYNAIKAVLCACILCIFTIPVVCFLTLI